MSRMIVCTDCGHMGSGDFTQYTAPNNITGEVEFATQMVVKMGFVYIGCPECESPNIFMQPQGNIPRSKTPSIEEYEDDDGVCDMIDEDEEDELIIEPAPPRKKKKKKKRKSAVAQRAEELTEDGIEDNDGNVEFKRGAKVPRKRMKKRCRTPDCSNDFETKHSYIDYCKSCLDRFAGK